jgi:hypothetical protein
MNVGKMGTDHRPNTRPIQQHKVAASQSPRASHFIAASRYNLKHTYIYLDLQGQRIEVNTTTKEEENISTHQEEESKHQMRKGTTALPNDIHREE